MFSLPSDGALGARFALGSIDDKLCEQVWQIESAGSWLTMSTILSRVAHQEPKSYVDSSLARAQVSTARVLKEDRKARP